MARKKTVKPSEKDKSIKAKKTGWRFKTSHLVNKDGVLSPLGKKLYYKIPTKSEIIKYRADENGNYKNKIYQVYIEKRDDRKHSDDNLKLKYEEGGAILSISELEAKLKREKMALDNKSIPDSIKTTIKKKIDKLEEELKLAKGESKVVAENAEQLQSEINAILEKIKKNPALASVVEKKLQSLRDRLASIEKSNEPKNVVKKVKKDLKEVKSDLEKPKRGRPKKQKVEKVTYTKRAKKKTKPEKVSFTKRSKKKPKLKVTYVKRSKKGLRELKDYKNRAEASLYNIEKDASRPAKKAGKRISREGNTYYEYRKNRADVNPKGKKKL